ncbi:HAD family hydrolase [Methanococcoides sp. SA1]|nr:HAD family hydrolase [Methanococcoides sp. SA1]
MYKAIIFDFDGVILESLDIKTKAFVSVYHKYPECADAITHYHLNNGGISRYKKFVHINNNIIGISIDEKEMERLAKAFSSAVIDEMIKCPFVNGALEFLKTYSDKFNIYIASGSPQDELRSIIEKRGIGEYFTGVYGTPKSKPDIITAILEEMNINFKDAIFIGDAMTDYDSAKETNIDFIARINGQTPDNPFLKMTVNKVNDLVELDTFFQNQEWI